MDYILPYLLDSNIALTNEDGILHEIFSMSSIDLKEKYGFDLEEIINNYFVDNKKRGK